MQFKLIGYSKALITVSVYYCFVLKCQPTDVCELATYKGCTLPLPGPL